MERVSGRVWSMDIYGMGIVQAGSQIIELVPCRQRYEISFSRKGVKGGVNGVSLSLSGRGKKKKVSYRRS